MNPDLHPERRQARVRQLNKSLCKQSNVWHTDATPYSQRPSCCAARFTTCTVPAPNIAAAEDCAIALAIVRITASGTPGPIVTDSQDAYRIISNGLGSPHTLAVLRTISDMHPLPQINVIWAPAHAGLESNETAHDWACECTNQDPFDRPVSPSLLWHPFLTYSDIIHYYPAARRSNCGWSAWFWTHRHRWPAHTRVPGGRGVLGREDLAVLTRVAEVKELGYIGTG
ncbi:hypothetical protein HPB48_001799 [Haemaphysalis longicornis]|uniref:Tick transposon n=1 Tax=Haemaphysalis longicornis TaxID=44386 RepID=A0A9J6G330_HAELO|nr:hypothetical protein HPB48_001799 [Haemaphysalis longicornis]